MYYATCALCNLRFVTVQNTDGNLTECRKQTTLLSSKITFTSLIIYILVKYISYSAKQTAFVGGFSDFVAVNSMSSDVT